MSPHFGEGQEPLPGMDDDIPTVFPPTLDKLLNGTDTAPVIDEWLATQPDEEPVVRLEVRDTPRAKAAPPPAGAPEVHKPTVRERLRNRRERRAAKRAAKRAKPSNKREAVSTAVELVGIAALSTGFGIITAWAGLICLGLCLILVGVAMSRGPEDA